ncbi:hypothetical protein RF11_06805 [Thelohanellus kitauei]|uniref:Uncharacterized protein n=1 Tax=Thelohanellus kitauei TaxID=669202 RepID=A0A0C2MVZ4_THEKT|nr:hypothetical protein RF11_06805 [Thelohanellus kitauei]
MDNEYLIKLLNDSQAMLDSLARIQPPFQNIKQFLIYQKDHAVLSRKVTSIQAQIARGPIKTDNAVSENTSSVRLTRLRLQLLWTDEAKKKENITGYGFFLVQNDCNFADSDLFEINNYHTHIYSPGVKIPFVKPNSILTVELYYNFLDNSTVKRYLKSKNEIEIFQFRLIGQGTLYVKDLIASEKPWIDIDLPTPEPLNLFLTGKGPSTSLSGSQILGSMQDETKHYYGTRLHYWHHSVAEFSFTPINLKSKCSKFLAPVKFSSVTKHKYVTFQGIHLNFYDTSLTYMSDPSESFLITDLSAKSKYQENVVMMSKDHNILVCEIEFLNSENAQKFITYFEDYTKAMHV